MKHKNTRIYTWVMNCTAPVLTAIFLAGSACWAAELQYGKPEEFDKSPEAVAAFSRKGLSIAGDEHKELSMPVSEIAVMDTVNSGAELVEACGVYIGEEFVGAVADSDNIEEELSGILESYRKEENIIQADFAVEPDLKQGLYRIEALVDEKEMADFLTGEKKVVSEYTAEQKDTPEKIAEDFDMSVEEVRELNPEIDELSDGEQIKVKESVSVLPVKYVCEEQEEEIVQIDAYSYDEDYELVPGGIVGRKISTYEVTYIDEQEVSRKLTSSETVEIAPEEVDNSAPQTSALQTESIAETGGIFSGNFIWPVNGGYVSDPFLSDRNHKGMDIAAPGGTDIYASDGGTVIDAGWNDGGYGNYVVIDHGNGYVTLYGHASEVYVSSGDVVGQGQLIAAVGTTGDSTGNHCHFEVRYGGEYLNPADFV